MKRGRYNSSITRVRPFFEALLARDRRGMWIAELLRAVGGAALADRVQSPLLPHLISIRKYQDRVLQGYGIAQIDLPACFEYELPPPTAFLRWLVQNPSRLSWPTNKKTGRPQIYGQPTQTLREEIVGLRGAAAQSRAIAAALSELDRCKAAGSRWKWWAFEGFTAADCYLETDDFILVIEGKRTEPLSKSTDWYPRRNQLIRNLEVVRELAGGKDSGVLVMVENQTDCPAVDGLLDASTPHLSPIRRVELRSHYLGALSWKEACTATGLSASGLPDTTPEVVPGLEDAIAK